MRRSIATSITLASIALIGIPAAYARSVVDKTHLTVGKTSTSAQKDHLWSCQTNFSSNAEGAYKDGPWMNGDGTWDLTKKVHVSGSVSWPNANITVKISGADRVFTGNALPVKATTGTYPVASTDAAYQYDRNPNKISAQTVSLKITATPKAAAAPQCAGGEVGISVDGPPIFTSIDAGGRDAQAYEVQDSCNGHPQNTGVYHYHGLSACTDRTKQFGWALDGFPIWGPVDPTTGQELSNDDLDECHGTTSEITIDGKKVTMYHYVANDQYPYTVGCFRGTPSARSAVSSGGGGGGTTTNTKPTNDQAQPGQTPPPQGQNGPPQGQNGPPGHPPRRQGPPPKR